MAYNTNTAAVQGPQNESWKATAFINFYLPSKNGGKKKLGAIPLKATKPNEKALIDWLQQDPSRVETVRNKLEMDFQMATPAESSGFALED